MTYINKLLYPKVIQSDIHILDLNILQNIDTTYKTNNSFIIHNFLCVNFHELIILCGCLCKPLMGIE